MSGAPQLPPADLDRRLRAVVVDHVPVLVVSLLAGAAAWWQGVGAVGAVLAVVVTSTVVAGLLGAAAGRSGRTPGRAAQGFELVDVSTGLPVGVARGAARGLLLVAIGWVTAGFGWLLLVLSVATDPRRRGWHDRVVGTVSVVLTESGSDPRTATTPVSHGVVNLTAARLESGIGGPVPPPAERRTPVVPLPRRWQVVFDGGESYAVDGRLLIGRAPATADADGSPAGPERGEPGWARLRSPSGTVSATHAELATRPDGALVLLDHGSTNGSWLVRGDVSRAVPPNRPTTLLPGDRVRFGDRWMRVGAGAASQ